MNNSQQYHYHQNDLPDNLQIYSDPSFGKALAIDTEAMGLLNVRDRLCLVQISDSKDVHLVHFTNRNYDAPNLRSLLQDDEYLKIFHFARFDVAILQYYLQIDINNIFCTKIASKMTRTFTDSHSLQELCNELLGIKIAKSKQRSDWGSDVLTQAQKEYAIHDVLYLHKLKEKLEALLIREKRLSVAKATFNFIPTLGKFDILGWGTSLFEH